MDEDLNVPTDLGPTGRAWRRNSLWEPALAVLVHQLPASVFQTTNHKNSEKINLYNVYFTMHLQRAMKKKVKGFLSCHSFPDWKLKSLRWPTCKVGFPWLAQAATAVQLQWYVTRAAVEMYAKSDVALLMNACFGHLPEPLAVDLQGISLICSTVQDLQRAFPATVQGLFWQMSPSIPFQRANVAY